MNPYAAERLTTARAAEFRAEAAQPRPAASTARVIRHRTGWALIQIGLALVTSSARRQHRTVSPQLP
jgi:hypothetical protein